MITHPLNTNKRTSFRFIAGKENPDNEHQECSIVYLCPPMESSALEELTVNNDGKAASMKYARVFRDADLVASHTAPFYIG